jgi:choline dehydrogenase
MKNSVRGGARDRILEVATETDENGNRKYHLDIKLNTLVTKIRFDQSGEVPRATGVEYLEGQSLYRADPRWETANITGEGVVNATKEVIIAGGAFNTPQLLKLSGIGPSEELAKFNIPALVDLPGVGGNLRGKSCRNSRVSSPGARMTLVTAVGTSLGHVAPNTAQLLFPSLQLSSHQHSHSEQTD